MLHSQCTIAHNGHGFGLFDYCSSSLLGRFAGIKCECYIHVLYFLHICCMFIRKRKYCITKQNCNEENSIKYEGTRVILAMCFAACIR